jgi:hypothetical protein
MYTPQAGKMNRLALGSCSGPSSVIMIVLQCASKVFFLTLSDKDRGCAGHDKAGFFSEHTPQIERMGSACHTVYPYSLTSYSVHPEYYTILVTWLSHSSRHQKCLQDTSKASQIKYRIFHRIHVVVQDCDQYVCKSTLLSGASGNSHTLGRL